MQGYRVTLEGKACLALNCYKKKERKKHLLTCCKLSFQNVTSIKHTKVAFIYDLFSRSAQFCVNFRLQPLGLLSSMIYFRVQLIFALTSTSTT